MHVLACALVTLAWLADGLDPHATLGIKRGASEGDIKAAYRALAKKYHPDKSSEPDASERFMEITTAYEACALTALHIVAYYPVDAHQSIQARGGLTTAVSLSRRRRRAPSIRALLLPPAAARWGGIVAKLIADDSHMS